MVVSLAPMQDFNKGAQTKRFWRGEKSSLSFFSSSKLNDRSMKSTLLTLSVDNFLMRTAFAIDPKSVSWFATIRIFGMGANNGENGFDGDSTYSSRSISSTFSTDTNIAIFTPRIGPCAFNFPIFESAITVHSVTDDGHRVVDLNAAISRCEHTVLVKLHPLVVSFDGDGNRSLRHGGLQRPLVIWHYQPIVVHLPGFSEAFSHAFSATLLLRISLKLIVPAKT